MEEDPLLLSPGQPAVVGTGGRRTSGNQLEGYDYLPLWEPLDSSDHGYYKGTRAQWARTSLTVPHSLKEKRKKNSSRPIRLTCVQLIKFVASEYAPTVSKVGTISRMRLIPALRARLQLLRSRITSFLRRPDTYITTAKLPSRSKSKGFWKIRHASLEPCARRLSRCVNDNIL